MRIGTTFGPFEGLFWIDLESKTITMKQGRIDITGEITLSLTDGQVADMIEGLIARPYVNRSTSIRPDRINCAICSDPVIVRRVGKIPTRCKKHVATKLRTA